MRIRLTLAACTIFAANLAGPAGVAAAVPHAMRFTVAPSVATPIEIKTFAGALCTVRGAATDKRFLAAFADADGLARIFVHPSQKSERIVSLSVECKAGNRTATYAIDLRSGSAPTAQMPMAPRTAMQMPRDAKLRPALSATQAVALSDADLRTRLYPTRPDAAKNPALYQAWLRAVSRPKIVLPPQTTANPFIRHGYNIPAVSRGKVRNGLENSNNWSGMEMRGAAGSFAFVQGDWFVPSVRQKGDFASVTNSSEWVGLDGDGLTDLVQAGSEQDVLEVVWAAIMTYDLWTEFLPQQATEQVISRIPISPGDEVFTQVSIANSAGGPPTLAGGFGVFLVDTTPATGLGYETTILTPVGTTVVGGSEAVWIMERPSLCLLGICSTLNLANYGTAAMSSAFAAAPLPPGGVTLCCRASAINITMTNSGGTALSTTAVRNPFTMDFTWQGFN